jgi:hypothetical protein
LKAVNGLAYFAAFLLGACATAQTIDGNATVAGNAIDGGHKRDSGTPSGEGGSTDIGGAGGAATVSNGGSDPTSAGGVVNSLGGAGGTMAGGGTSSGVDASTGGVAGGTGGTTDTGGSTQGTAGTCAANQKLCNGACVAQIPSNGCSAASCSACPIPAPTNGLQMCDAQGQCNFECLSGYQKNGTLCTMGGGGAGGAGGTSGAGGEPTMCGNDTCHKCFGNQIGCCNKLGDHCICVFPTQTDQCG